MNLFRSNYRPISGVGIGLRAQHINEIKNTLPAIPWLELLADNHLLESELLTPPLQAICEHYPVTLHSVGLSVASTEAINNDYCQRIKTLAKLTNAAWISGHLCFNSALGMHSHDLLPIPYNQKTLDHCVNRILQIQEYFAEQLVIENVSSYLAFRDNEMSEIDFMIALVEKADCCLLVDVNNIYVNQYNQDLDALDYIDRLPIHRIKEIHLAGFQQQQNFLLDAHNNPVAKPVWKLYQRLVQRKADIPCLIEWDNDIPPLQTVLAEAHKAELILEQYKQP